MTPRLPGEAEPDEPNTEVEPVEPGWSIEAFASSVLRQIRRLVVAVVGMSVLLVGLIMTITPGPAFVVIPLGLAILALEFAWAGRLLRRVRERASQAGDDFRRRFGSGKARGPGEEP